MSLNISTLLVEEVLDKIESTQFVVVEKSVCACGICVLDARGKQARGERARVEVNELFCLVNQASKEQVRYFSCKRNASYKL